MEGLNTITKPRVLLLVSEDHRRGTHAISRQGWLTISKQLVDSSITREPQVLRVLEESPRKAGERKLLGYCGVVGLETETIFSEAYKKILRGIIDIFPPNELSSSLKDALIAAVENPGVSTYKIDNEIIGAMDIKDLQLFFGKGDGAKILEKWFAQHDEVGKASIIQRFCNDVRLHLSYSDEEIGKMLTDLNQGSFYGKLFLITEASTIKGRAGLRYRENSGWVNTIRIAAREKQLQPNVVVVFVGKEHLRDAEGIDDERREIVLPGLESLFKQELSPFTKMYVASNIRDDMPQPPELPVSSGSPSRSSDDKISFDSSTSLPSDTEDEIPSENEDFYIKHVTDELERQRSNVSSTPGFN